MSVIISRFNNIKETTNPKDIELNTFLHYIQDGHWQDNVFSVRLAKTKEELRAAKELLPYGTISGKFSKRDTAGLIKHSGFLALDFDAKVNPNIIERRGDIYSDKYIYSGFITASGQGLCLIIKVEPGKHLEAFQGAEEYYFKHYDIIADPACKDVTRPRYVSYDPELYLNEFVVEKFKEYPKVKPPKRIDTIVFAKDDFEALIKEIGSKGVNIVDGYFNWMRAGFALADKFGESGRQYFHIISSQSGEYNSRQCDRQFDNCMRSLGRGQKVATIAVLYYLAKQSGLTLYSEKTKTAVNAAVQGRKGGRTADQVAEALAQFESIFGVEDIIRQVFNSDIEAIGDESLIDQILLYLKHNHSLRKNEVTRFIEDAGKPVETEDYNSIYLDIKRIYDKTNFELFERIIHSRATPSYNPIKEYFEGLESKEAGFIDALADCILSEDFKFTRHFLKKWIVGIVASVYGDHSPLMFILSGPVHGKGKTEFFRRLFPLALKPYYAETSPGMKDTDFFLLMTQKLLIVDDECGNKSKKEDAAQKALLSKQDITVREPYGRKNITLPRLASMGGTTNEDDLLSDTDNRRFIPLYYFSHNYDTYNSIDKDKLFAEAYNLYRAGFNYHLTMEDKEWLRKSTGRFQKFTTEYELIVKYFRKPNPGEDNYLSATEIKNILETRSVQKIAEVGKVAKELKRLGYESELKRVNGSPKRAYNITELGPLTPPARLTDEDLPEF